MKKFKQGKFTLQYPEKYIGDISKITYRSSWEYKFMLYCDLNKNVIKWGSEEIVIPYISPKDGKPHRYYPDFIMTVNTANGIRGFLVEIKPVKDTQIYKPKTYTQKSQYRVAESILTMEVNKAKWEAAKKWCKEKNIEFLVLTENELFN